MLPNHTKRLLASTLCLGFGVRTTTRPDIAIQAKMAGYQWLFLDQEHTQLSLDCISATCLLACHVGITPIVRVNGPHSIPRTLDCGAQGYYYEFSFIVLL